MKRILCIAIFAALLLGTAALADAGLTAEYADGAVTVRWSGAGETLTLYRNGWPVCVAGVQGKNTYTFFGLEPGTYIVKLRGASGCMTAAVTVGDEATPAPAAPPAPAPVVTPVPEATAAPSAGNSSYAERVLALVNEDRARYGAGALRTDAELTRAALVRAYEIAEHFSHTRPDGSSWSTVSDSVSAENIAMGYRTPEKAEAAWLSSEGHRRNMLNGNYSRTGIACIESDGVMYWVQLFGR